MAQDTLMTHCPATGGMKPYPSHAAQWRRYHGTVAWLFNPWSGTRRDARDVGSDPFGAGIGVAAVSQEAQMCGQQRSQS